MNSELTVSKQSELKEKKHFNEISYLRIFATICVVYLHTCSTLALNNDLIGLTKNQRIFFNTSYEMMNLAVPVFFMITGFLFLKPSKKVSVHDVLFKYSKRLVLAIIVFDIPFTALRTYSEIGGGVSGSS